MKNSIGDTKWDSSAYPIVEQIILVNIDLMNISKSYTKIEISFKIISIMKNSINKSHGRKLNQWWWISKENSKINFKIKVKVVALNLEVKGEINIKRIKMAILRKIMNKIIKVIKIKIIVAKKEELNNIIAVIPIRIKVFNKIKSVIKRKIEAINKWMMNIND